MNITVNVAIFNLFLIFYNQTNNSSISHKMSDHKVIKVIAVLKIIMVQF